MAKRRRTSSLVIVFEISTWLPHGGGRLLHVNINSRLPVSQESGHNMNYSGGVTKIDNSLATIRHLRVHK